MCLGRRSLSNIPSLLVAIVNTSSSHLSTFTPRFDRINNVRTLIFHFPLLFGVGGGDRRLHLNVIEKPVTLGNKFCTFLPSMRYPEAAPHHLGPFGVVVLYVRTRLGLGHAASPK